MDKSFRKRMISGLLAGLMVFSNINIPTIAADMTENETILEEESSYEVSGQSIGETESQTIHVDEIDVIDEEEVNDTETDAAEAMETQLTDEGLTVLSDDAEVVGSDEAALETSGTVVTGTFQISGTIAYNEKLDGMDWSSLVRPSEFDQPIRLTMTYTDSLGAVQTVVYDVQDDLSQNAFYLKFVHDGQGGGDFVIENVPKSIKDSDGVECQVTGCSVNVEPSLPYYVAGTPITIEKGIADPTMTLVTGTLELNLKTQTLTLQPTVIPSEGADNPSFTIKTTYTNPQLTGASDADRKLEATYRPTKSASAEIRVPVGLSYSVVQSEADGYRFDGTYTTTTKTESGEESSSTKSTGSAAGTIEDGIDVTITTENIAQNLSIGFDVKWIDNEKTTRPALSEDNFTLQYKTENGDWITLDSTQYESLGIENGKEPKFDASLAALNQYSYTGLPAVNANGEALTYQVTEKNIPDGYTVSRSDDEAGSRRIFTFEETTGFTAEVQWNDTDNTALRPVSIESLRLYRRAGNGNYELVYDKLPDGAVTVGEGSSAWSVKMDGLARYSSNNQEYDYVLVQGSITYDESTGKETINQENIENYKIHYDNNTGSFGNDTALCHNGGTITEVLYESVDFKANKVWKDPEGNAADRPTTTVTLWRYTESQAAGIDEAYQNGVAAQVVFQTTDSDGNVKESIVSYQLEKRDTEEISFTSETVAGLPEGYQFPLYDDHGRKYVYFVRETLSGENKDEYEIQYTDSTADGGTVTYTCGAPTDGTITNVHRKKEAVAVTKIWQNPSGLDDIEGISVQMEIRASADGGETYDTLTVYSDTQNSYEKLSDEEKAAAQTISGFSSAIAQGETVYYVNTCDGEGRPYDMAAAKITETVTAADGTKWAVTKDEDGQTTVTDADGHSYVVKTSYIETTELANGMNQHRYTQTNTITAKREYTLIKQWGSGITDKAISEIASVNFRLERRSTKDNADGTQAAYEAVKTEDGAELWTVPLQTDSDGALQHEWTNVLTGLPKYDAEGYEYYYRAIEVSFTDIEGKTFTTSEARADETRGWAVDHYRTPEQTKAVNYVPTSGRGYFTVSKLWQDNGDNVTAGETRKDVTLHIYKRSELKAALEKLADTDAVTDTTVADLDTLMLPADADGTEAALKYYSTELKASNDYTAYVYYGNLDAAFGEATTIDNLRDYIVLEYLVGDTAADGATPAQYTYGQLTEATETDAYSVSGTVSNSKRQYRTQSAVDTDSNGQVVITNTRSGVTTVKANKTWTDGGNFSGLRPSSIRFQLYRDGSAYTEISENVTVIADKVKTTDTDSDGNETETVTDIDSCTVSLDRETGVITVSSAEEDEIDTKDIWSFTITGLDMFSLTAVPYSYSLDELADSSSSKDDSTSDKDSIEEYSYIQKKLASTATSDGKTQTYTFEFENTITGTTSHIAYKYWKDSGIGAGNRPDLYMNLYRYLKKDQQANKNKPVTELESCQLYKDYDDQIWSTEPEDSEASEFEHGYNWKITVKDLPRYDKEGNEYGYVFTETMNNGGKTVLGTYVSTAETIYLTKEASATGISDSYEVFTNALTGYMTLTGKKTWAGLTGYRISSGELPDPVITLYRTTDSSITDLQGKTQDEIDSLIEEGRITLVDTTKLTGSSSGNNDKSRYTFPDSDVTQEELDAGLISEVAGSDGTKTYMLPKFDPEGERYTYLIKETIADPIASQLYNEVNNNGTLSNIFRSDINRRRITVTKEWDRGTLVTEEDKYPSVTFSLYRYEAGKDSEDPANCTLIETHTIGADEFAAQKGKVSYTFDDLLIYSPTGVQYCYYIEEKAINGYSVSYTDEAGIAYGSLAGSEISTGLGTDGTPGTLTVTEDMLDTLKSNDRIDVISLPKKWNDEDATEEEVTAVVGAANKYDKPGTVIISGEKAWNDYFDFEEIRPKQIDVTLNRHTNNESGQSNRVESIKIALEVKDAKDDDEENPYIVWNYGDVSETAEKWTYTIYNLPRYAPNGMPYIYTLSEDQVKGYKKAADVSAEANSDKVSLAALQNQFDGTYYVRKNWMDGNNKYNLRPTEITVKLQRTTDGTTWKDIIVTDQQTGTYNKDTGTWSGGLPSVSKDEDGNSIISITLNKSNVIKNTRNNSWEYTFTNLPTEDKDGNAYTYRCVETAIGGVQVTETTEDGTVKYSAGAYECRYTTKNEQRTVLENTLNDTSLVVTKQWKGDQDNLYQSRPDKLTFVLQKRSVKIANESAATPEEGGNSASGNQIGDWSDVLKEDGTPYTFTISAAEGWTKTLEDLPTAAILSENGTDYTVYSVYFRAVELHTDDTTDGSGNITYATGKTVTGSMNYEDITDYALDSKDHTYNAEAGRNESTITNKLILDDPAKSITVTKIWRRSEGTEVTAVFELLYRTKSEGTWHCYGDNELKTSSADATDKELTSGNDWTVHTGDAKDSRGNLLEKQCKLQTVTSTEAGSVTVVWKDLPRYDQNGNELVYKVVEHPVSGYRTEMSSAADDGDSYATAYTFINTELQSYTVKKIWQNTDYAERASDGSYTATFKLQKRAGSDGQWSDVTENDVADYADITLTTKTVNDSKKQGTWKNLPKYTADDAGNQVPITYRAVETKINGKDVDTGNSNGSYIASYEYVHDADTHSDPTFEDTQTIVTNRMIYGFVNLSKAAAYLAPEVTENGGKLEGVVFDIYRKDTAAVSGETPYVSEVKTDKEGHLIQTKGKYGKEQKYLIAGTYILREASTKAGYSVWDKGIEFTVGNAKTAAGAARTDTGEHGTAWISTRGSSALGSSLSLNVEYLPETETGEHTFADAEKGTCQPQTKEDNAVNLESRGVVSFIKTGEAGRINASLDTHEGATGESNAYFGVYLDKECTIQVAGMVPQATLVAGSTDYSTMILTDKAQDGSTVLNVRDAGGIPYLRSYGNSSYQQYPYSLLSGVYYIKELTAPAGYRQDTAVRKLVIDKIDTTDMDEELTDVYAKNQGRIMDADASDAENGSTAYQWSNIPNKVTLYKLDQFGRQVPLANEGSYLELTIQGDGNTFPGGENTIRLYQSTASPAAIVKADTTETSMSQYISYTTGTDGRGCWTVTGLLEAGKTYILSEPETSVGENYIIAKQISFRMNADGTVELTGEDAENDTTNKEDPLTADGTDYSNAYRSDSENSIFVLRDVSRYLKDVALEKKDSKTDQAIADISFKLYKYDRRDDAGNYTNKQPVLADSVYLTTDENGKIELNTLAAAVTNQITGGALKYGLDVGNYYFEEVERGASDSYRLADKIYFTITPKEGGSAEDYNDYAKVTYDTADASHISTDGDKTVTVKNDPVTSTPKTLKLIKTDSQNGDVKLAGARFTLTYKSITHGQDGSSTNGSTVLSWNCITDRNGVLYLADEDWAFKTDSTGAKIQPDISGKGSYILKEIQAPDGYMTPTKDGTTTVITMATFEVNSANQIIQVKYYDSETGSMVDNPAADNLVTGSIETETDSEEHIALSLAVKNEKTKVSVAKLNDMISSGNSTGTKTCDQQALTGEPLTGAELQIYEGVYSSTDAGASDKLKATLSNDQSEWSWTLPDGTDGDDTSHLPEGTLKENTIYTLHEAKAPVGYLTAEDIYFQLSGITTEQRNGTKTVVSQLYVWTGSGKPGEADRNVADTAKWSQTTNLDHNVLTMVDEAVIAPVDMQKVVGENGSYQALQGAVFEVKAGDVLLGTAKSAANGYLVWDTISTDTGEGYATDLIFNAAGKRVTSADHSTVIGNTIILQQNAEGYTFTEIYAPDHAYNEGRSFTVKITAENYKAYRQVATSAGNKVAKVTYDTTAYIDILAAAPTYTVTALSHRNDATNAATAADLINPPFEAKFQLYKYDAENSAINDAHKNYDKIGMEGVTFTLSRKQADGTYKKAGDYTTGKNGLLSINITEKGTYQLQETETLTGYQLNDKVMEFTITNDDYKKTLTYLETEPDAADGNHTVVVKDKEGREISGASVYDLANYRNHGTVTLTKQDADSKVKLNEVKYTLTRISPEVNANVDRYFPSQTVTSLTVETGKTYSNVAGATEGILEITGSSKDDSHIMAVAGADGVLTLQDLQWGTYKLVEQQENDGYILDTKEFTFTISGTNLSVNVTDTGKEWVENTKNRLTIKKISAQDDGKALNGAEFSLYPVTAALDGSGAENLTMSTDPADFYTSADATKKSSSTTITAGETTIYGLTKGTYVLREMKAPDGYELARDVIFDLSDQGVVSNVTTCTVNAENQAITKDAHGDATVSLTTSGSGIAAANTLTVKDVPIEIYIRKLGEDDTALQGAKFILKDACGTAGAVDGVHKLANGSDSEEIEITAANNILIPIERLIGGHTYTLTETKAPDGYECTAVVTFHVKTDGTIDTITSTGGYKGYTTASGADKVCASTDEDCTTINIMDEKIRMSLTKVDGENADTKLSGVTFTLAPYGKASDGTGSSFVSGYDNTGLVYDSATDTYTFTTDTNGGITFPDGLLKHDNSYLLKETATADGYYLGKEAKDGVILTVGKDGGITITRLDAYKDKTVTAGGGTKDSCPVSVEDAAGSSELTVTNRKATSFDLTKKVEGNMGDLSGTFQIRMDVYEPDGTHVGTRTVSLKLNETYDSVTGIPDAKDSQAFGSNAIPVGATLVISEDNGLDYTAVVKITSTDGKGTVLTEEAADKGTVKVTLDTAVKVSIELTNRKEVILDVGIITENQAPLAAVALLIPALWLAYRYRRKRKGGEASR